VNIVKHELAFLFTGDT